MGAASRSAARLLSRLVNGRPSTSYHQPAAGLASAGLSKSYLDEAKRRLVVQSTEGLTEEFPWVWLRDNCQCPLCFEASSRQRIVNLAEFDLKVNPTQIQESGEEVKLVWSDGHVSPYPRTWLQNRSFRPEKQQSKLSSYEAEQKLWGCELTASIPKADFRQVMSDDQALLGWLEDLDRYGFVLMENVPTQLGPVADLQKRVCFGKLTHYGHSYDVEIKPDPSNIAYTPHRIFFHADLTYYDYMPGVALLHCIKQHTGRGGETMLVDGFRAAQILKQKDPDMYKLMSETVATFRDVGVDYTHYDKLALQTFLIHDARGNLERVNWSHFGRDSHLNVDIDKVEELYTAMRTFDDILNDDKNHIKLKMKPGDMVTLKNKRVLHGRTELVGGVSQRHLACGYLDWDEIRSTTRVLKAKLNRPLLM